MSEWPYEEITNHVSVADGRLTSQYDNAENLKALIQVDAERVQDLEGVAYSLLTERWLSDAVGQQLDKLGAMVGEPRIARDDSDYRDSIFLRIQLNRAGGEPEQVLTYLRVLFDTDDVRIDELYPANIEIFVNADVIEKQAFLVQRAVGAGIGVFILNGSGEVPFGFSELGFPTKDSVAGFGELQLYNNALELTIEGGGPLSELTEV